MIHWLRPVIYSSTPNYEKINVHESDVKSDNNKNESAWINKRKPLNLKLIVLYGNQNFTLIFQDEQVIPMENIRKLHVHEIKTK